MATHAPITGAPIGTRPIHLSTAERHMAEQSTDTPIAMLRALPAGPLAKKYRRLKRLAKLFAAFDRHDMEAGVDLLLAEMDAQDGDTDREPEEDRCEAGDDTMMAGPVADRGRWWDTELRWRDSPGSDDDAEPGVRGDRCVPTEFATDYVGDRGFGL